MWDPSRVLAARLQRIRDDVRLPYGDKSWRAGIPAARPTLCGARGMASDLVELASAFVARAVNSLVVSAARLAGVDGGLLRAVDLTTTMRTPNRAGGVAGSTTIG